MNLADKECLPCRGGVPALPEDQAQKLLEQLDPAWGLSESGHLERAYAFPDFVTAMRYVNELADLAEEVHHHPDLHIGWGRCMVEIWTHKIDGLTESDFVFAAKAERVFRAGQPG
ncbi:MAG: 4a-hydroxytetrahydrobiopterin dehydratase [Planctomycetota bacterium]|jgi:4a-hydroxytetrahydrobiopterin dehydratase